MCVLCTYLAYHFPLSNAFHVHLYNNVHVDFIFLQSDHWGNGGWGFAYLVVMLLGHPPVHHPLDAHYYSVVDELLTELIFGFTLVTNSVGNRSHIYRYIGR